MYLKKLKALMDLKEQMNSPSSLEELPKVEGVSHTASFSPNMHRDVPKVPSRDFRGFGSRFKGIKRTLKI